ncbi:MAG: hypothetical protein KAJ34_05960, partial [Thermodesulfovibrionia bacterium]|nr:hypothetical protein [Thermodesulfovibrionia bacterium]
AAHKPNPLGQGKYRCRSVWLRLSLRPELRPRAQPKSKTRLLALSEVEGLSRGQSNGLIIL